jgi:type I restriction enzyme S subunit
VKHLPNDNLPPGWVITPLGNVASFEMGQAPPGSASNFDGKGTAFVKAGEFGPKRPVIREWTIEPKKFAAESDVLICVVGATAGKLNLGANCAIGRSVASIRPSKAVTQLALYYQLLLQVESLRASSTGSAQGVISKEMLGAIEVALPPLAEQKRIADKLEAVLGRVDACRARLDRVPDLLKRFRQSVLAAATSGQLTEDWREENGCGSKPWDDSNLGQLCEKDRIITYGVIKLGDETPNGVPCLRTSNVRWLRIDITGMKRIAKSLSADYSRTILKGGEVLVNVRGTLGGVAVAEEHMAGWNVSREVAVLPVDQKRLMPSFLAFSIGSDVTQRWLGRVEKGVAYTGINIEDLRELPVKIPTLTEQAEIVRRVEALFAMADRIEARLATAQRLVERLTPATLSKAFRGDLVPQDPNDEPASKLRERLTMQPVAGKASRKR